MNTRSNSNRPKARIIISTYVAIIEGVAVDVLRRILEAITPTVKPGGELGYELGLARACHYEVDRGGGVVVMAGLVPRVVAHLKHLGYRVKVQNKTLWETLINANHGMREDGHATAEDQRFLDALAVNPRGLIVVGNDAELVGLIATIGSFFPSAHMVIVAANTERREQLYPALNRCCDRPVKQTTEGLWSMPAKTLLCTLATFSMCRAEDFNLVVFTDPESALAAISHKNMATMIREAQANMMGLMSYCFLPMNQRLGQRERLRLEEVCGGEIYRQAEPGEPPADVSVILARVPECPPLPRRPDLEQKRALWQNAARNAGIARLAIIIASDSKAAIERCGLLRCLPRGISDLSVAILVECVAHGDELLKLLPGWRLWDEVPALGEVAGGRAHARVDDRIITTLVYAQRNGVNADVFIRADGAVEWPLAANAFPWVNRGAGDRAFIVDIIGDRATRNSQLQRRVRSYELLGWDVEGPVDIVLGHQGKRSARTKKVAASNSHG